MSVRKLERDEIRRLYIAAAKECLKLALANHDAFMAPEARVLHQHPLYGFGVGVEFKYHGRIEHEQLGVGAKELEGAE